MNKETMCCPVCNAKLRPIGGFWDCPNDHRTWAGTEELWQALIQSQKDLENAKAGFAQIRAWCSVAGLSGPVLTICEQQIKAIEERLDNEHRQIEL